MVSLATVLVVPPQSCMMRLAAVLKVGPKVPHDEISCSIGSTRCGGSCRGAV